MGWPLGEPEEMILSSLEEIQMKDLSTVKLIQTSLSTIEQSKERKEGKSLEFLRIKTPEIGLGKKKINRLQLQIILR